MPISSISATNSVFRSTGTPLEPFSDLDILRQAIPDNCSFDDKKDLQQQKRAIVDKLIKERPVDTCLDLTKVSLSGVDLLGLDLDGADLRFSKLSNANLSGAFLNNTRLNNSIIKKSNLNFAFLKNANLSYAKLENTNLRGAKLVRANLGNSKLEKVNLSEADLAFADLNKAHLKEAILNDAYLNKAKLNGADLSYAKLKNANLSGADLSGVDLNRADLTGANLSNTKLNNIYLPDWDSYYLDLYLNHVNNSNNSFLKTIDSIKKEHDDKKIDLVHQLIDSLDKRTTSVSLSSVVNPLLDTLAKAPYNRDDKIINWVNNNILPLYLVKYDATIMPLPPEPLLETLLNCFNHKSELMFSHNSAFIQLISQAMAGDSSLKEQVKSLYDGYLQDSRIESYTKDFNFGNNGQVDWSDKEHNNFILLSAQQNSPYSMMISQVRLRSMLGFEVESNMIWNGFYLFQDGEVIPTEREGFSLTDLFNHHFKIFAANYQFHQDHAKFSKLLATLALGELQTVFQKATTQRFGQIKLIDYDSQVKLATIFDNKFKQYTENGVTGYRLSTDYTQQLLQVYNLSTADKTTQAETLLSLAAVFRKYSSRAMFGTETDSPNALRYFAFALMEQAHQLAPQIFKDEEQYKDWGDRLLGYNDAFSCTAVLSTIMIEHIKAHFPSTLAGIMPPAWS